MKNKGILSDENDDIVYYPQMLLEQLVYRLFSNNTIIYSDLEFTDNEPDKSEESEETFNEDTACDE